MTGLTHMDILKISYNRSFYKSKTCYNTVGISVKKRRGHELMRLHFCCRGQG